MDINQLIQDVLTDEKIAKFVSENSLTEKELLDSLPTLLTQKEHNEICDACKGKKLCGQDIKDMATSLTFYNHKTDFNYQLCPYKQMLNESYVELLFVPEQNYTANLDLYKIPARGMIFLAMKKFIDAYTKNENAKGFYIHGMYGVGKTFILLKFAQMLSEKHIKVLFTYYPDLVRTLKSAIGNNSLEGYISRLKDSPVLMLDDLGAESNSEFIRDEVLGPILQYRVQENLPVFVSSNLSLELLEEHFKEGKGRVNAINGSRIIERMKLLCEVYELTDKNYRL